MAELAQTITPMLSYEEPGAAADWLCRAFGFTETFRLTEDDGRVSHVDLELGGGHVMLGCPSKHYEEPRRHAESCERARRWRDNPYVVDGVYALVDDVDAHHARAREAGATILSEPEDGGHGARIYAPRTPPGTAGCSRSKCERSRQGSFVFRPAFDPLLRHCV